MQGEAKTLPIHLALLFIVLLFTGVILYARHVTNSRLSQTVQALPTKFSTYVYKVDLSYPSDWQPTPGYNYDHYDGPGGFFALSAVGDAKTSIDMLVRNDTTHTLKPYGTAPTVTQMTIDGEPARLIIPSGDQDPSMNDQAEIIVKYPAPVTIGGEEYYYLLLWADGAHIKSIGSTLSFLK